MTIAWHLTDYKLSWLNITCWFYLKRFQGFITINGKRVVKADQKASNGLIHYIDGVMLPPKGDLLATVLADERLEEFEFNEDNTTI